MTQTIALREHISWRLCTRCSRTEPCDIVDGGPREDAECGTYRLALCGCCQRELGTDAPVWVRTYFLELLQLRKAWHAAAAAAAGAIARG